MVRSLKLNCGEEIGFDHNQSVKEIKVTVDGQRDNGSFTVTTVVGDWFNYSTERGIDYVRVILKIPKNLSTMDRFGILKFEHNSSNIVKYVEIKQEGVKYELKAVYDNGWMFKSTPGNTKDDDIMYEEKKVRLVVENGRKKWYVKEVQQYQTLIDDNFDDINTEYNGSEEQDKAMSQVRVPYDGAFNYRVEGNELIIRSYGQIDLITKQQTVNGVTYNPHMRYFFVLSHSDVNNGNKLFLDENGVQYQNRKLFIFDGDYGKSYKEEENGGGGVEPIERDNYNFLVNNSVSPTLSFIYGGETKKVTVTSTKNGNSHGYEVIKNDCPKWCTINADGTEITLEENKGSYREYSFTYKQNVTGKVIKMKIAQSEAKSSYEFEVTPVKFENVVITGGTFTVTVISTKNKTTQIPFTAYQQTSENWVKYDDKNKSFIIEENKTTNQRSAIFVFKQEGGSPKSPISLEITQLAAVAQYVFSITPTSINIPQNGERISFKVNDNVNESKRIIYLTTLYNDQFKEYELTSKPDWIEFNNVGNSKDILILSNDNRGKRTDKMVFKQTGSGKTVELTISQKGVNLPDPDLKFVDGENESETMELSYNYNGTGLSISLKSINYDGEPDENISFENKPDWITIDNFNYIGDNRFSAMVNCTENVNSERSCEITFVNSSGKKVKLTVKQAGVPYEYTYELLSDNVNISYEAGYYEEPYGTVYSYGEANGEKKPCKVTEVKIKDGNFIKRTKISGHYNDDPKGPYYKITVEVEKNELNEIRVGHLIIINERGKELELTVTQRKNGEVVLTKFDYIVMNYQWTDFVNNKIVYSRDFDCAMYFDTQSIGDMYHKCAYFGNKTITDKIMVDGQETDKVYAELAYDQITSASITDVNRIETQVVYLKELKDDGYLDKIKQSGEKILKIKLYGNLYKVTNAEITPQDLRTTQLSIHTYLGGTMERDDTKQTMVNKDGTEVNVGKIQSMTYLINSISSLPGSTVETLETKFDYLGIIEYDIAEKTAVFTPNR